MSDYPAVRLRTVLLEIQTLKQKQPDMLLSGALIRCAGELPEPTVEGVAYPKADFGIQLYADLVTLAAAAHREVSDLAGELGWAMPKFSDVLSRTCAVTPSTRLDKFLDPLGVDLWPTLQGVASTLNARAAAAELPKDFLQRFAERIVDLIDEVVAADIADEGRTVLVDALQDLYRAVSRARILGVDSLTAAAGRSISILQRDDERIEKAGGRSLSNRIGRIAVALLMWVPSGVADTWAVLDRIDSPDPIKVVLEYEPQPALPPGPTDASAAEVEEQDSPAPKDEGDVRTSEAGSSGDTS